MAHLCNLARASDLDEQVLAARRQVLGHDHPGTLRSMNDLAAVRRKLGRL